MTDSAPPSDEQHGSRAPADPIILALLCDYVSSGMPLLRACDVLDIPVRPVYRWIDQDPEFCQAMEAARAVGYDRIAEETLEIADDATNDTIETKFGPKADKEWIARSKLRVETRLKLLAKWHPKRYGEKLEIETKNRTLSAPMSSDPVEAARQYTELMQGGS